MQTNSFVDYLNSMNNASSNTIAALAESQVLSPFFEKIQIDRRLGTYIADKIRNHDSITVVLTGHAGDGKTSILVQVLRELGMLRPNLPLKEEETFENNGMRLYAVKDMSELPEKEQIEFCRKALEAPRNNMSSIVISNTGPLLKCLESIKKEKCEADGIEFNEMEKSNLQSILLNQLDSNENNIINIDDYSFLMINIARVDNVCFVEEVLDKILKDELWQTCNSCEKRDKCHIRYNVEQVKKYRNKIVSFINAFYRYLYENDKRMTIRQMLSQISFSITGNRTCKQIRFNDSDSLKFKYLFSNLFFGYSGFEEIENAEQIQGIAYARDLKLDSKGLKNDYQLFVSGDFSFFPTKIKEVVEKQYRLFSKRHLNIDEDNVFSSDDYEYRKAIRRTYIFFEQTMLSNLDVVYNPLFDELFGVGFNSYTKIQDKNASHSDIKKMEKMIADALYLEMTGTSAKQVREIPLTIKRNDDAFQNVMITVGSLKKSDLKIISKHIDSPFEDTNDKFEVYLRICNKEDFQISLPMIVYFGEIASGAISTVANPSLTHGISKLNAVLEKNNTFETNDEGITIVVNNTDTPMDFKIYIDKNQLYIE